MPEIRIDPLTGQRAIIAGDRAGRPGGELSAMGVVDRNRAELAVAAPAVQQHDERASVSQRLKMANATRGGGYHNALHPLLLEESEVPCLAIRRAVCGAHDDGASLLVHGVFEAADRLGGERVGSVEYNGTEAAAVSAAHLVRGRAPNEADPFDNRENACKCVRRDDIRTVEDVRGRAERDA